MRLSPAEFVSVCECVSKPISDDWKADPAAAMSKYCGKTFYVYGRVDAAEGRTLYLEHRTTCRLEKGQGTQNGKICLIRCQFDGHDSVYIVLKNGVIIWDVEDTDAFWEAWKSRGPN